MIWIFIWTIIRLVHSPPTHKAGKDLDLILLCNCTSEKLIVTTCIWPLLPPLLDSVHLLEHPNTCSPWLTDSSRKVRKEPRTAERKWHTSSVDNCQSLLSSFSSTVTAAKKAFYMEKADNSTDTTTFTNLLNPPPPPSVSSLSTDDFAMFFTENVPPLVRNSPILLNRFDFIWTLEHCWIHSPLSMRMKSLCFINRVVLQHIPWTQFISPTNWPAITHVVNAFFCSWNFPTIFKQTQVTPLRQFHLTLLMWRNIDLLYPFFFLVRFLKRLFSDSLSQNNFLDHKLSGFKSGHSTESVLYLWLKHLRPLISHE